MPPIIGEEKKSEGTLKFGATDPITGRRFEEFTPNITSEMLIPAPSVPFVTPQDVPVFPVAGLDVTTPPLQPTAPETQAQDITKQLQELNQQLLGQSTLQAEQEKVQGIPELQKTQTDLTAQLKAIQNEALAIPLQLQKEATGRGITVGGLQPLQTERLRTNAIQALGVASLLEASRGNLATAQTLADRAVAQKFDPIKEEIAVKTANLELILKSPAYSLADKNRAQAQLDAQNAKLKQVTKQETDAAAILTTATEAAKNGADALTLQKISQAKTPAEALQLAVGFLGADVAEDDKLLSPNEAALLGVPYGTTQLQAAQMNITPKTTLNPQDKIDLEVKLSKGYVGYTKEARQSQLQISQIESAYQKALQDTKEGKSINAASQGVLVSFQKLLDPTSVVRESEYARSGEGLSLLSRIQGKYAKITQGGAGVTAQDLKEFVDLGREFYKNYGEQMDNFSALTVKQAENYGLNIENILPPEDLKRYQEGQTKQPTQFNSLQEWINTSPANAPEIEQVIIDNDLSEEEALQLINRIQERSSGKTSVLGTSVNGPLAMRTDRHNNPTAFTTSVARQAGLKQGVDYEVGDPFPKDPSQKTARLLGDPVETTIKVIDKIGFYTTRGKQRWTHTAMTKSKWDSLSREQKKNIIKEMYRKEGGTQLLNAFA